MSTVEIAANGGYSDGEYIETSVVVGQLQADDWSDPCDYYAAFLGVLAHETQHATNQTTTAQPPGASDADFLPDLFETIYSETDSSETYSARDAGGYLQGTVWHDGEVYAGGPVEEAAFSGASTALDWAHPGTNWNP